jgi:hypothetical protein
MTWIQRDVALANLEESAWLAAVIRTAPPTSESAGAVKFPSVIIVPTCEEPRGTPLTFQLTAWSELFVHRYCLESAAPSKTEPTFAVMTT